MNDKKDELIREIKQKERERRIIDKELKRFDIAAVACALIGKRIKLEKLEQRRMQLTGELNQLKLKYIKEMWKKINIRR